MYIDSISLENIRTFAAEKTIAFNHPDKEYGKEQGHGDVPKLKNVNLIFGENACGKTTLIEAIALAALGPAVNESRIDPRPLVRFAPATRKPSKREKSNQGRIEASVVLHGSESYAPHESPSIGSSKLLVSQLGELEGIEYDGDEHINWSDVYRSANESFFVVAYGASRRVDSSNESKGSFQRRSRFSRVERIESIVQEAYPLVSLPSWLSRESIAKRRWHEVVDLINGTLGSGHFVFKGQKKRGEYVFAQGGMEIPFRSLSDGYKAFLGWVTDLLYHLAFACEDSDQELNEVPGIVLVDEVDLHLHPSWQMQVIERVAKTFPRLQFIFTSHSPLVAGSVEWMNITRLRLDRQHRTGVDPFEQAIHGLDADQILVSELFGLESTRAPEKRDRLYKLRIRARSGDDQAARDLISELAKGLEANQ